MKISKSVSSVLFLCMQLFMCMMATASESTGVGITNCTYDYHSYYTEGPKEFKDIFKGTPTKPPEISENQGLKLAEGLISIGIGEIPEVGSLLKGFFDLFTSMFGENSVQTALDTLYQDLETEVKNLKLYVDEQIDELEVKYVRDHLGALEIYAQQCMLEDNPPGMLRCAEEARREIVAAKFFMMPQINDTVHPGVFSERELRNQGAVLERILPMLRHYGDLLIAVTMEVIAAQLHSNNLMEAENYKRDLSTKLNGLITYMNKARSLIELYSIATYDFTECEGCVGSSFVKNVVSLFSFDLKTNYYKRVIISSTFGPGGPKCTSTYFLSTEGSPLIIFTVSAQLKDLGPLFQDQFDNYQYFWEGFRNHTLPLVRKYYDTMFGKTIDNWKRILTKLGSHTSGSITR